MMWSMRCMYGKLADDLNVWELGYGHKIVNGR